MTQPHRRRLDVALEPEFVADLADVSLDDLRSRRDTVDAIETELSFYRRLLHGRLDLLRFELSRRRGEETRSLIEALPQLLAGDLRGEGAGGNPLGRLRGDFAPSLPEVERRFGRIMNDDFITRLSSIDDDELAQIERELVELESDLSTKRSGLHAVHDALVAEMGARYRPSDDSPA